MLDWYPVAVFFSLPPSMNLKVGFVLGRNSWGVWEKERDPALSICIFFITHLLLGNDIAI